MALGGLALAAWLAQSSAAEPVSGSWYAGSNWAVTVYDEQHQAIGSMTVRVTAERADSCIGGDWKRLEILRRQFKDSHDVLATEPLSYSLEGRQLTLGVTAVCDRYVFLRGEVTSERVAGDYGDLGLGGFKKLGTFSAVKYWSRPLTFWDVFLIVAGAILGAVLVATLARRLLASLGRGPGQDSPVQTLHVEVYPDHYRIHGKSYRGLLSTEVDKYTRSDQRVHVILSGDYADVQARLAELAYLNKSRNVFVSVAQLGVGN